jgi:hypothetical protein
VTNNIAMLPSTITKLRMRTDMLEPTTLRSSSLSADRRETSSPLRVASKNAGSSVEDVRVQALAQVGDHALAQQRDEEETRGRWPARGRRSRRTATGRPRRCSGAVKPWSIMRRTRDWQAQRRGRGGGQREQPGDETSRAGAGRRATALAG